MDNMKAQQNAGMKTGTESKTVAQYLFDCLKAEGITDIFGVPGDYNFTLLDALKKYEGIRFVNGRNELNSGYAADGYARVKGMSALITTFGVGELSACNAVAGANSEHVPLVHIVGAPPDTKQKAHKMMHHTLMDGNFDVFRKVYEPITVYTAVVNPENAQIEIPAAIRMAKEKKKPVYLMVADDIVAKPVVTREQPAPSTLSTSQNALQAAVDHVRQLLENAKQPVILVDVKAVRFGLQQEVRQLADAMNVPVAAMMYGKGAFDETHPNYIGMYGGAFGSPKVRNTVENADCVIAIGPIWADTNTASFTMKLNPLVMINIQPEMVKVAEAEYSNVPAADMLREIEKIGYKGQGVVSNVSFPYDALAGSADDPLKAADYYPRFQRMLKENDIVIAETGTFFYGMSQVRLPRNVTYIVQGGWESIGYATPSAYGASIAAPDRRVLLFTGDGSLQLTAQEISSMLYYGCKPIIFVLNNDGYTIEKYLNVKTDTDKQPYNEIPRWSYTDLAKALGGNPFTVTVRTNGELEQAIAQVEKEYTERLCIIEMIAGDPMDAPEYMIKMREFMEEQQSRK